jgi:HK97 family phage major capsid protein
MKRISSNAFRQATLGAAKKINDKAVAENRDLSVAEQAHFDSLLGAFKEATGLTVPSDRASFGKYMATPIGGDADGLLGELLDAGGSAPPKAGGALLRDANGRVLRCLTPKDSFAAAVQADSANQETAKWKRDGLTTGGMMRALAMGPSSPVERAALSNSTSSGGGGFTTPDILAADVIDLMRAKTHMVALGAQTVPLPAGGDVTFARVTADPTPSWRAENAEITESAPTFGALVFKPKSLACNVRVSRELLQDSANAGALIESTLANAFALELDRAGMFGTDGLQPLGLVNWPGINAVASFGTPNDYTKILDGYKLILDDNAPEPTGVIMSNREWRTYAGLEDSTGQPLMRPKAIENLPFASTSAVPTNEGGGAESTMLMGHFPDFVFGIRAELQIELLRELYAGNHQYAFIAHLRLDTGVFQAGSFCKLTGVTSA